MGRAEEALAIRRADVDGAAELLVSARPERRPKRTRRASEIIIRQNQTQIKATELQIATDVTARGASRSATRSKRMQAAQAARELSEKRAEAAQSKLDVGMATNFEVVQAQRDLADARNQRAARAPELPPRARRLPAHPDQPAVER